MVSREKDLRRYHDDAAYRFRHFAFFLDNLKVVGCKVLDKMVVHLQRRVDLKGPFTVRCSTETGNKHHLVLQPTADLQKSVIAVPADLERLCLDIGHSSFLS